MIIDLNVKMEDNKTFIRTQKENTEDLGFGDECLHITAKV